MMPRDGGRDAGRRDAGRRDSGPEPFDAGVDAGTDAGRDAGPPMCPAGSSTPAAGKLAIVELMVSSNTAADSGEWFEIRNISACPVALSGIQISTLGTGPGPHTMNTTRMLMPFGDPSQGDRLVLAQSNSAGDNHGLPTPGYVYGTNINMDNASDTLTLRYSGAVVHSVTWSSTTAYRTSISRQFTNTGTPQAASDIGTVTGIWCDSSEVYSNTAGGPYYGSPGRTNCVCPLNGTACPPP